MSAARLAIAIATLPAMGALAACATTPDSAYPSLGVREAEYESGEFPRPTGDCAPDGPAPVTGQFEPTGPVAPPPPPPPVLSADLAERVVQLEEQARAAHADFEKAVPATRAAVRGSGSVGSKAWGRAQVAYANLESIRARTAIPFADLDSMLAIRSVNGEPVEAVAKAHAEVARLIAEEDAILNELAPAN
ncbi:hypothetical protein AAG604_10945 [Citromicrobium bathyomarinum]